MKRKKRILALFVVLTLLFSIGSTGVSAFDGHMLPQEEIEITFNEADVISINASELILQTQLEDARFDFEGEIVSTPSLGTLRDESAAVMSRAVGISPMSVTQRLQGFITTPTQFQFVPFSLGPNEVVQLTLETPPVATIDYHLHLYTFNPNTGVIGNLVAFSELATFINSGMGLPTGTVAEAIGFRHPGPGVGNYVAIIFSERGSSTVHPFTLTVSFDHFANWDQFETNDSPFTATTLPSLGPGGFTINGMNLNVPNDQDWILFNNTTGLSQITLQSNLGHAAAVYTAVGRQMRRAQGSIQDGVSTFNLAPGANYIRIFSTSNSPSRANHTINMDLNLPPTNAANINVTLYGDEAARRVNYNNGLGTMFRYSNHLRPWVELTDNNGRPVGKAEVRLTIRSAADPYFVQTFYTMTDVHGVARFDVSPHVGGVAFTATIGEHPHFFRHFVDIENLEFSVVARPSITWNENVFRLVSSIHLW